jgi:hypothetical protein
MKKTRLFAPYDKFPKKRFFLICCGEKSKTEPNKCCHSGNKREVCSDCSIKESKKWYVYGYEDAKKNRSRQYKEWKHGHDKKSSSI